MKARRVSADVYPNTPDGRYFVVRGRLWRRSNPRLAPDAKDRLVRDLMRARRAVQSAKQGNSDTAMASARRAVDRAKRALGERGDVWWSDGAPDYTRFMVQNSPYARWYARYHA